MGFPVQIEDQRLRPEEGFPEFVKKPIVDRAYQLKAVDLAIQKGSGVLDMVPRSGKTRCACEIQRRIALPTLWIAPTDRIVRQTQGVLENFFGRNYAIHLVGTAKTEEVMFTNVVVCTAATAVRLSPEFYQTRKVIIVDEFHRSAAKTYKQIFAKCAHIYYRFGMTGTFFRSGLDGMAMHALLSDTIYRVTAKELLELGFLVPTKVVFLPVLSPRLRNLPDQSFQNAHGKFGIQNHDHRNQLVTMATVYLYQAGKRVLVLVGTKAHGRRLRDAIQGYIQPAPEKARFQSVEFLNAETPRPIQGEVIESFLEGREVKVLIGTSLLGEGVDLPSADALVYARGEKARVSLTQNAYRVGTATPGKTQALLVDFADRHNKHLMRHSLNRLEVYHAEDTFSVEVLQDPNGFLPWLREHSGEKVSD
jgi:superfamily II DNA or RNA helicase